MSDEAKINELSAEFLEALPQIFRPHDLFRLFSVVLEENSGSVAMGYWLTHGEGRKKSMRLYGWAGLGVPEEKGSLFVKTLVIPVFARFMREPCNDIMLMDMSTRLGEYPRSLRHIVEPYLVGLSMMVVPLISVFDEMDGVIVCYRRGEQPFLDSDVELANMVAPRMSKSLSQML